MVLKLHFMSWKKIITENLKRNVKEFFQRNDSNDVQWLNLTFKLKWQLIWRKKYLKNLKEIVTEIVLNAILWLNLTDREPEPEARTPQINSFWQETFSYSCQNILISYSMEKKNNNRNILLRAVITFRLNAQKMFC